MKEEKRNKKIAKTLTQLSRQLDKRQRGEDRREPGILKQNIAPLEANNLFSYMAAIRSVRIIWTRSVFFALTRLLMMKTNERREITNDFCKKSFEPSKDCHLINELDGEPLVKPLVNWSTSEQNNCRLTFELINDNASDRVCRKLPPQNVAFTPLPNKKLILDL